MCANTLRASFRDARTTWAARHTSSLDGSAADARDAPAGAMTARPAEHALRVGHGTLTEFPLVPERRALVWTANLWLDGRWRSGWARRYWRHSPAGRGWLLPVDLTGGDLIEFGADQRRRFLTTRWARQRRWYGYITAITTTWLVVHGPYDNPGAALDAANAWRAPGRVGALHQPTPPAGPRYPPAEARR